jgi:hypothetical protein
MSHLLEKMQSSSKSQKRFAFIESVLVWEGSITPSTIADQFEIHKKQAELLLHEYMELYPDNVGFNGGDLIYQIKDGFVAQFFDGSLATYLQYVAVGETVTQLAMPNRNVQPVLIRPILQAIRQNKRLVISYASVSTPEFSLRSIQPHNMVFDGLRWHVRAYCEKNQGFRDFVLSRFNPNKVSVIEGDADHFDLEDEAWHQQLDVTFIPDPRLDDSRQRLIALDYDMESGENGFYKTMQVRAALLMYFVNRLGLDQYRPKPEAQQIILDPDCQERLKPYLPT